MFSLFDLIQRYIHVFLFLFLELIAFYLIVNYNQKQKDIFLYSSSQFSGYFIERSSNISDYAELEVSNKQLLEENARLIQEILNRSSSSGTINQLDTTYVEYEAIPGQVINQSIHSIRNHLTINRGRNHGVTHSMGVITTDGVAGIVMSVSDNYSTVMSLLNVDTRISATFENRNYFGTIVWNGKGYYNLNLKSIPRHAEIQVGEVVVTNGFSTIFPKGIPIGKVKNFNLSKNGISYDITVELINDMTSLSHVYLVKNNLSIERLILENE